eukprot:427379_1
MAMFHFLLLIGLTSSTSNFRFSNTQGNNMVLQQKPYKSQVWGYGNQTNDIITVTLKQMNTNSIIQQTKSNTNAEGIWSVQFNPITASFTKYSITATNTNNEQINITNIVFGDIYVCSGQSNMQFTVDQAFNVSQEVAAANNYPYIRLLTVGLSCADNPLNELQANAWPYQHWSVASSTSVGVGNWSDFSAVCWYFGRSLYDSLKYPIGLIATSYWGSPIRMWIPNEYINICNETDYQNESDTFHQSCLYNAMIAPLIKTTIRGVIWYQGEADTMGKDSYRYATEYECAFPLMINVWRQNWNQSSGTDVMFPFGYVQLAPWNDGNNNTCNGNQNCLNVGIVRWAQSCNFGYVPNEKMKNVFMATAIDLGQNDIGFGDVHPRYKLQVGQRLALAARNVVYDEVDIEWGGPYPINVSYSVNGVLINFRNVGKEGVEVRNNVGFEMFNGTNWFDAFDGIMMNDDYSVIVKIPVLNSNDKVLKIRYNWYQAPCMPLVGPYNCAIYDKQSQLPATPFIFEVN